MFRMLINLIPKRLRESVSFGLTVGMGAVLGYIASAVIHGCAK